MVGHVDEGHHQLTKLASKHASLDLHAWKTNHKRWGMKIVRPGVREGFELVYHQKNMVVLQTLRSLSAVVELREVLNMDVLLCTHSGPAGLLILPW